MVVAVYGSLKRGYGNYPTMERANGKFITEAVSTFNVDMDGRSFPYINLNKDGYPMRVEIFEVEDIEPIDWLEGHPSFYKRELKEFKGEDNKTYEAWVYILQDYVEHNEDLLKGEVYEW